MIICQECKQNSDTFGIYNKRNGLTEYYCYTCVIIKCAEHDIVALTLKPEKLKSIIQKYNAKQKKLAQKKHDEKHDELITTWLTDFKIINLKELHSSKTHNSNTQENK